MRRFILFLAFGCSILIPTLTFADRTTLQNGNGVEIGEVLKAHSIAVINGGDDNTLVKSGKTIVYDVIVSGKDAGDGVFLYDLATVQGYNQTPPRVEVETGTAAHTVSTPIPGGAIFNNGLSVRPVNMDNGYQITIIYD